MVYGEHRVVLVSAMKAYVAVEVQIHSLLSSALNGNEK